MTKAINWKIFFSLLCLSLLSVICVFPYIATVQGEILEKIGQPIALIFLAQFIQCIVLFSIAIFFGLYFSKKTGFSFPLFEAVIKKENCSALSRDISRVSISAGIAIAAAIYALDSFFTLRGADISTHQSIAPVWQKLLAAFYGGITEEILMRLFLMAFFVWIGIKLSGQNQPTKTGIIISIILAAVIFGLGHLPLTAALTKLDPLIITRAIVLNGIGGIAFGWLFWKKGFESAMIAHFTTDIFLLTILPLIF